MFLNADIVVKVVMIGLAFASVVTWTVWLAKGLELVLAKRRAHAATLKLRRAKSLGEATRQVQSGWTRSGPVADLVEEAANEARHSEGLSADGVKERLAIELSRIEARAGRRMAHGAGLLATIAATAPFVGLFGTVWGIMNAFIGISRSHTTNLAVVAPGIAEALLATAIGLVAAIPSSTTSLRVRSPAIVRCYRTLRAPCSDTSRATSRGSRAESGIPTHPQGRRNAPSFSAPRCVPPSKPSWRSASSTRRTAISPKSRIST
jgi:biopolymer transport protein ExbB